MRRSSRSIASRMNSPRLFGPAKASIRAATSDDRRMVVTTVSMLRLSGGRPMRGFVPDSIDTVKPTSITYSVIDPYNVFAYNGQTDAQGAFK